MFWFLGLRCEVLVFDLADIEASPHSTDTYFAHMVGEEKTVTMAATEDVIRSSSSSADSRWHGFIPFLGIVVNNYMPGQMVIQEITGDGCVASCSSVKKGDVIVGCRIDDQPADICDREDVTDMLQLGSCISLQIMSPKKPVNAPFAIGVTEISDPERLSQTPVRLIVSGADGKLLNGIDCGILCNGEYVRSRVLNGKSVFKKVGGEAILYYSRFWKLNYTDATGAWCYGLKQQRSETSLEPPEGVWRCDGCPPQSWDTNVDVTAPAVEWIR